MSAGAMLIAAAVLAAGTGEEPREQGENVPVVLTLRELGLDIERQKVLEPGTQRVHRVNRLRKADGTLETIDDAKVTALASEDARRYRERAGVIHRGLLDDVLRASVEDPARLFAVAVFAPADATKLPHRLSTAELRGLDDDELDARARERLAYLQDLAARSTVALQAAIRKLQPASLKSSRLAPVVYAELTADAVLALARQPQVLGIYDASHRMVPELATSTCAINATTVQARGVSAGNLEVAILEHDQVDHPLNCLDVDGWLGDSTIARHPTAVAGIVASTLTALNGVAPGANILSADIDDSLFTVSNIEDGLLWAYDHGADVYNMSFGTDDSGYVEAEDVLVDYFVRNYARTVVKSAGNIGDTCDYEVTSPGQGFNTITVGNSNDMGSCFFPGDSSGDTINASSCWGDPWSPHGDRQKPEVAAPGTSITTLDLNPTQTGTCIQFTSSGTSFSAPHVAGAAALLIARDLAYKEWPELTKATLMATAFNNVDGNRRLSETDGAGAIDAAAADDTARLGRWWASEVTQASLPGGWKTIAQIEVKPLTSRFKVAIAWDSNPNQQSFTTPYELTISNDFDLYLYKVGNQAPVAVSDSWDNSYETVDLLNPAPGLYELRVMLSDGTMEDDPSAGEFLGVAWGLLEHPCAEQGSDADLDGVCGDADNCPTTANAGQQDFDGDGVGDACDNCLIVPNPGQEDSEPDGKGDACDDDKDNDGCKNNEDHAPLEAFVVTGYYFGPLCNPPSGPVYSFDGVDTDGDSQLNCKDADDDQDGIPDAQDSCPLTSSVICMEFRDCPAQDPLFMCGLDCVEYLIKVLEVSNPDPSQQVVFDTFQVVDGKLYVQPLAGQSLAEAAEAIAPGAILANESRAIAATESTSTTAEPRTGAKLMRLEVWKRATDRAPSELVSSVLEYDPSSVLVGTMTHGRVLQVVLPGRDGSPMTVKATWLSGVEPETPLADADEDRIPDAFDNCEAAPNPRQEDADRDGVGDACESGAAPVARRDLAGLQAGARVPKTDRECRGRR